MVLAISLKPKKSQQRLLKNLDAQKEVLGFLSIARESCATDVRMREITALAHIFLRRFCHENHDNQRILHHDLKSFLDNIHNVQDASTITGGLPKLDGHAGKNWSGHYYLQITASKEVLCLYG